MKFTHIFSCRLSEILKFDVLQRNRDNYSKSFLVKIWRKFKFIDDFTNYDLDLPEVSSFTNDVKSAKEVEVN